VEERSHVKAARVLLPWGFVEGVLQLAEPGAILYLLEDCLIAVAENALLCSNLVELPEMDFLSMISSKLSDMGKVAKIPAGFQALLQRAEILAGSGEALLALTITDQVLQVQTKQTGGSLDEKLVLKGKMGNASASFPAGLITRALKHADAFSLSKQALALYGGESFLYLLAARGR
jgi:hypothetical protein